MANQNKKAEAVKSTPAFRGYVRRDIQTEEDVDSFHTFEHNSNEKTLLDNVFTCVDKGYKLTLKIDGKGYKVELFNVSSDEETHGYILSAYGNSSRKALTAVFFKHFELLQEDWTDYVNGEQAEVR
jgi:hypothetical protein